MGENARDDVVPQLAIELEIGGALAAIDDVFHLTILFAPVLTIL